MPWQLSLFTDLSPDIDAKAGVRNAGQARDKHPAGCTSRRPCPPGHPDLFGQPNTFSGLLPANDSEIVAGADVPAVAQSILPRERHERSHHPLREGGYKRVECIVHTDDESTLRRVAHRLNAHRNGS